ncbi:unnamed protein product [Adineta steineri]|uniref:PH domain-containing protein n=1 Tax=Adineta steineri TaxID=433720 RepID=A0A819MTH7_9BILA|nr:unnamed protein product [Adineta steineri]CAF3984369.1 unnamed protein product [Adineta steineri]
MTLFEGTLRKWTNVLQGWQNRFFVLDPTQGKLIYYTSTQHLVKNEQRGVILLKGAHIGIDTEDGSTFTIRTDGNTFHFQARDTEERQKWIRNLEDAISFNTVNTEKFTLSNTTLFQSKILEADQFLQLLIKEVDELEQLSSQLQDNHQQQCYNHIIISAKRLIEAVKYSIVSLQLAKVQMNPLNEVKIDADCQALSAIINTNKIDKIPDTNNRNDNETTLSSTESTVRNDTDDKNTEDNIPLESLNIQTDVKTDQTQLPVSSNSISDDDDDNDFYDADDVMDEPVLTSSLTDRTRKTSQTNNSEIPFEQYEAACEESPEEDLAPIDGTIISHLISQARISMDLTKITLPTFILERRSFLEMLADFLAHPDEFIKIADYETPRERFIQVVKWYLSAFHAGRKSAVPKKPYNPILGEIFQCSYDVNLTPSSNTTIVKDGPVPWASDNQVTFIAEQTSHHPPIASFYAECPAKHIQIDGCLWTRSKFLGLSVGVHMIGDAIITLLDHDEQYVITFPSAFGRSILGVPWFEMGGKITITCEKTGYTANIDFLQKPFLNGKKHQITGILYGPDKKEFCRIDGEWNGIMNAKYSDTKVSEVFFDTKATPVIKKIVRPIIDQDTNESRRMWKDVTYYLKSKQLDKATGAKSFLEHRQRTEAKERHENSLKWETKHFSESGELKWTYANKLSKRLNSQS